MKRLLKSCLAVAVIFCMALSFTACGAKVSATTVDTKKVGVVNGVSTNGGMTAIHDGYLYFINGTITNDGTSLKKNTQSAICRVKYNASTGETTGDAEVVVGNLVGFSNGSIRFYGDYMYFTTPCSEKNYAGDTLYNKTTFMRYDLLNEKSYKLYTTYLNDANESIDYAYYVVGETLNLLVYEVTNATITSLKIDKEVETNYVIEDVTGCVFAENGGIVEIANASADANSYVFYTKAPEQYEEVQTGSKVYRTSPVKDNSFELSIGHDVTLDSVKAGNLITVCDSFVYCHAIKGTASDALTFGDNNCISYINYENYMLLEHYALEYVDNGSGNEVAKLVRKNGHVSLLCITDEPFNVMVFDRMSGFDEGEIVGQLGSLEKISLIGVTQMEEILEEEDEETPEIEEEKRTAVYAVFIASSLIYKIEIAVVEDDNTMVVSHWEDPIKLSTTKATDTNGILYPEIIGSYAFVMSENKDKKVFMYKVDLTPNETVSKESPVLEVKK